MSGREIIREEVEVEGGRSVVGGMGSPVGI